MKRIAIIGGGLTGLAAAWELQKQGLDYILLESAACLGGKVLTERVDGFIIEGGADSYVSFKPAVYQLCTELDITSSVLGTNDGQRNNYILSGGKLQIVPRGMRLIVPLDPDGLLESSIVSEEGKQRILAETGIPPRSETGDESLASFMRRRYGQEALDLFGAPMLAGIYSGNPETMSMLATYPNYLALEQKYGSITLGSKNAPPPPPAPKTGAPTTIFSSFKNGMGELVEALQAKLTGEIRLNEGAVSISKDGTITTAQGNIIETDAVIITTPAHIAGRLLAGHFPELVEKLGNFKTVSSATVSLGYRLQDIPRPLDGFGFVVAYNEPTHLVACTWSSTKLAGRAPEGYGLLRVFLGGHRHPDDMLLTDEQMAELARNELEKVMGISAAPVIKRVYRWIEANPQYEVGHLERIAALKNSLPPWLWLVGSPYEGIGLPDCVKQGREAARQVPQALATA